jgi:50S ribosomal protein L16 3-hydroxylase
MLLPVTEDQFLAEYWQQKPLLCPRALPHFRSPLSAEELAGLAMEADVESRLVWQDAGAWQQRQGPFTAEHFQREGPWTLLVQRVDSWAPAVSALRNELPKVPRWRFDDVMVSFATDGAGVGPHFDRYDVFLLQGTGQREWRIGPHCDDTTTQLNENGLSLLPPFEPEEIYVLNAGDVLYLPPGIAHWGIARGNAITYSLGFRAPTLAELMARRTDAVLEHLSPSSLLEDGFAGLTPGQPGEITAEQLANARDAIHNAMDALDTNRWFGELVTEPGDALELYTESAGPQGDFVRLIPTTRIAWIAQTRHIDLFVMGEHTEIQREELECLVMLCRGDWLERRLMLDQADTLYHYLCSKSALTDEEIE